MKIKSKPFIVFIVVFLIIPYSHMVQLCFGQTKFGDSLEKADIEGVRKALKEGANPNERKDGKGHSALNRAVSSPLFLNEIVSEELENNIIKVLEELFKAGAKLMYYDNEILYFPVARGAKKVTKYLLERGANPNEAYSGDTPVSLAIENGHDEIAKLLIEYGAKPLDLKTIIQIRFISAAGRGDLIAMRRELSKGADVNEKSPSKKTALVEAVQEGHLLMVKELLKLGAKPNITGEALWGEMTPLHRAAYKPEWLFVKANYTEIVKLLLKHGAHVSSINCSKQKTPLHLAASLNNTAAAKILLDAGAKVMPKDADGKTPLDYATSGETIKLLKSYGAKEQ